KKPLDRPTTVKRLWAWCDPAQGKRYSSALSPGQTVGALFFRIAGLDGHASPKKADPGLTPRDHQNRMAPRQRVIAKTIKEQSIPSEMAPESCKSHISTNAPPTPPKTNARSDFSARAQITSFNFVNTPTGENSSSDDLRPHHARRLER